MIDDGRVRMFLVGAVLGLVLIVGLRAAGPPRSSSTVNPALPSGAAASLPPPMDVAAVYARFAEPGLARMSGSSVRLSVTKAGDLELPSGRVVVADSAFFGQTPLNRVVRPGPHPVFVLVAQDEARPGVTIAAAMVRFGAGDPVSWDPAIAEGTTGPVDRATFASYGVDSGTAAFAAAEAVEKVSGSDQQVADAYFAELDRQLFPAKDVVRDAAVVVIDPTTGANVVAFPSGFGDGGYAAWFGLDGSGEPLVLLTSFDVLDATRP